AFEHYPKFRADAGGPPTRQPESKPGRLPRLRGRASTGSAPKARGASSRLERQTVRNAPRYAENCVGQSARVGRGTAEFTSAGRGGACRPDETRLERRSVKPIGVLGSPKGRLSQVGFRSDGAHVLIDVEDVVGVELVFERGEAIVVA